MFVWYWTCSLAEQYRAKRLPRRLAWHHRRHRRFPHLPILIYDHPPPFILSSRRTHQSLHDYTLPNISISQNDRLRHQPPNRLSPTTRELLFSYHVHKVHIAPQLHVNTNNYCATRKVGITTYRAHIAIVSLHRPRHTTIAKSTAKWLSDATNLRGPAHAFEQPVFPLYASRTTLELWETTQFEHGTLNHHSNLFVLHILWYHSIDNAIPIVIMISHLLLLLTQRDKINKDCKAVYSPSLIVDTHHVLGPSILLSSSAWWQTPAS